MLTVKTRIEKEYQGFVILNFFIPHLKHQETTIDNFYRKIDYLFLNLKLKNTIDFDKFNETIQKEWAVFLKDNKRIILSKPQEKVENLFKQHPLGDLIILKTIFEDSGSNKSSFNITKVNLEILHFLENQKENEAHLLKLFLVFIYVFGGYSPKKITELSEYFLDNINFDKQTRILLDEQVNTITIESKEFFVSHISTTYKELLNFYKKGKYPSPISKWKYSYKQLNGLGNLTLKNNLQPFKQLRNQLNISDSESYAVLSLLHHYFKN